MESQIIDYYNEMPYGVNVIEKMNQELEVVQARIKELELEGYQFEGAEASLELIILKEKVII